MIGDTAGGRIPSIDHHAPPPPSYLTWDDYMRDEELDARNVRDHHARRGLKALALAPTPAVYLALLTDQPVPVAALDPDRRRRYGL